MTTTGDIIERLGAADPLPTSELEAWDGGPDAVRIFNAIIEDGVEPVVDPDRKPSSRRWARVALAVGVVLAAALVFLVGFLPGDSDIRPATAAEALTRAAQASRRQPAPPLPGPGEYAYVRSVSGYQASFGSWAVMTEQERETWVSPDGSGLILQQPRGWHFFGPRDRARCQRQHGDACERIASNAGEDLNFRLEEGEAVASLGNRQLTYEELLDLTTDPAELGQLVRQEARAATDPDYQMFVIVGDMLRNPLMPGDLRVALYEVAARIPNVGLIGEVTDPAGRAGTAVGLTTAGHVTPSPGSVEPQTRHEIIFDQDTGVFLAERDVLVDRVDYLDAEPGTVVGWAAYVEYGVVDAIEQRPNS